MAILGEGNVSTRSPDGGLLIKASGHNLATLTPDGVVACRDDGLLSLMNARGASDDQIEAALLASRQDPTAPKPSVETLFHAYLLGLPGIEWVGHTHCIAVNRILCSPRAREFAQRRMFPDEVVCCGEESVFIPYTDPGLKLAVAIRDQTQEFLKRRGIAPRVILLANHGIITLGTTDNAVLGAMLMAQKAATIWLGAATLGGPEYLTDTDVRRIAGRSDEHYRQRTLNI
jgi:rhamnose utilization protein RhaD (predicted bifunctional aldolase and dehydrogenase)